MDLANDPSSFESNVLETGWIETRSDANVSGVLLDAQEAQEKYVEF